MYNPMCYIYDISILALSSNNKNLPDSGHPFTPQSQRCLRYGDSRQQWRWPPRIYPQDLAQVVESVTKRLLCSSYKQHELPCTSIERTKASQELTNLHPAGRTTDWGINVRHGSVEESLRIGISHNLVLFGNMSILDITRYPRLEAVLP